MSQEHEYSHERVSGKPIYLLCLLLTRWPTMGQNKNKNFVGFYHLQTRNQLNHY